MQSLTPLDAGFLQAEDSDPHVSLAIAAVAVIDGPAPSQDEFLEGIVGRLALVPHALQKVHTVPFDLGAPTWIDDRNFELGHHFRRTALPAPGDDAALGELVARVMAQRLDRERPLWECWVIEGLADGRWAVLSKVHHAMADGIAGARLFEAFCDPDTAAAVIAPPNKTDPVAAVGFAERALGIARSVPLTPAAQLRVLLRGAEIPLQLSASTVKALKGLVGIVTGVLVPSTSSSLLGSVGKQRRYAVARTSMTDVREIKAAFGTTINDVALAAVTGALRSMLLRRGEQPTEESVRTLVPVSVRSEKAKDHVDNQVSLMLPFLPVELDDPVDQLIAVHERMSAHKLGGEATAGHAATTVAAHTPFAPVAWAVRLATRLPQHGVDIVATNVPGPRYTRTILGRNVIEVLPFVPIAMRLTMGIAILSYADRMTFGITGDYDSAPDVALLATSIEDHLDALLIKARVGV